MPKKNKKKTYIIFTIIAYAVFLFAISWFLWYRIKIQKNEGVLKEAIVETQETQEHPTSNIKRPDFEKLYETNGDIYAWISIEGTKVDYPVLQSETDNYYLDRNLDDSKGYPGCIYTNSCNTKDFSDDITVLYGHNMKDDSMFGELHSYAEKLFFDEHGEIKIYTPDKCIVYEVFAAVKFSDVYIPLQYGTTGKEQKEAFLLDLQQAAMTTQKMSIIKEMQFEEMGKILVLSTCISNEADKRYLVCGVWKEEMPYNQ